MNFKKNSVKSLMLKHETNLNYFSYRDQCDKPVKYILLLYKDFSNNLNLVVSNTKFILGQENTYVDLLINCMIHPDTELRLVNEMIGYGVFATKLIPKGTITWILDELDRQLDETYVMSLDRLQQEHVFKYTFRDRQGKYILCWDIAKYINHSFNANSIPTAYNFEIAVRDIYPGEELTSDYASCNLDEPFECLPEPGIAKTKVMPEDFLLLYPEWDRKAAEAMKYFDRVKQPLKGFIASQFVDKINAVAAGKATLDSILNCYYDPQKKLVRA